MHPSDRLRGTKSALLAGRRVVVGVSGSIAAVEVVRLLHELKRHGAETRVVMTGSAQGFVTPMALQYASGSPVVTELTGEGEHLQLVGGGPGSADVLLLAPATANTVAKVALGVDDTPVTTCASVALGAGVPVVVAPAMHDVMLRSPAIRRRMGELRDMGVLLVEPKLEEEKAKMAPVEVIVDYVVRAVARGPWKGRKVLVVSGATAEPVDPIRVLTNRSSGRMGVELARAAFRLGADVELWNAWGLVPLPEHVGTRRYETVADLLKLVRSNGLGAWDAVFMPAALSDFAPEPARAKISSGKAPEPIRLKPLPKVILEVRKRAPKAVLVAFKAESDPKALETRARDRLKRYKADLVVANSVRGFGGVDTEVLLVGANGKARPLKGPKDAVARQILEAAGALLPRAKGGR